MRGSYASSSGCVDSTHPAPALGAWTLRIQRWVRGFYASSASAGCVDSTHPALGAWILRSQRAGVNGSSCPLALCTCPCPCACACSCLSRCHCPSQGTCPVATLLFQQYYFFCFARAKNASELIYLQIGPDLKRLNRLWPKQERPKQQERPKLLTYSTLGLVL